jgi:hypothetical protein
LSYSSDVFMEPAAGFFVHAIATNDELSSIIILVTLFLYFLLELLIPFRLGKVISGTDFTGGISLSVSFFGRPTGFFRHVSVHDPVAVFVPMQLVR